MKKEVILILILLATLAIRFIWAITGWGAEVITLYPPLLAVLALIIYYHSKLGNTLLKVISLFFVVYVISLIFNIAELKGGSILLFLGTFGFILFPVKFFLDHKKKIKSPLMPYAILLGIILIVQSFLYLFVATSLILTLAHMLSYGVLLISGYILFKKRLSNEISRDEKMILTFLIIVNILSLMGVMFKESFYSSIWI